MLHLWGKCIRTCRKRNARSSRSRSATARASGRWPVCRDAARPASTGRSGATRGSRPTRASPDGRTGRNGWRRARGRAATTSRASPSARPTGAGRSRASHTACHTTACGRGWPNGRVAAGRRRRSAAGCAFRSRTTQLCACAPRPSTGGSIPASRGAHAGPAACRAATGGAANAWGARRRGSRSPDGSPSRGARRRRTTGAGSSIGSVSVQ